MAHQNNQLELGQPPSSPHEHKAAPRARQASVDEKRASRCSLTHLCSIPLDWVLYFPWGTFAWSWTLATFCTALSTVWIFPVGPLIFVIFSLSWRMAASVELHLAANVLDHKHSLPYPVVPEAWQTHHSESLLGKLWNMFSSLFGSGDTWRAALYFLFLKFPSELVIFLVSVVSVSVGLGLIVNPFLVAHCSSCYPDDTLDWIRENSDVLDWMVNKTFGQIVMAIVGLALFLFAVFVHHQMRRGQAQMAERILGSSSSSKEQREPLRQARRGGASGMPVSAGVDNV
jgi:hypothetical protein